MASEDLLERTLNAGGNRITNVGTPEEQGDATLVDNRTVPSRFALEGVPGQSLLAAPADHMHPAPFLARIAASGVTYVPGRSTVSLADFERQPGELFLPNGLVWLIDDLPIAWSAGYDVPIDPQAALVATWHARNQRANALSLMAANRSPDPVQIAWASIGYTLAAA